MSDTPPRTRRIWLWSLLVWSVPAVLAGIHTYSWSFFLGHPVGLVTALVSEAPPWYVMALVTPPLLAFARRHPLRQPVRWRAVALHVAAFVIVNAAVVTVFTFSYMLRRPEQTLSLYLTLYPHILTGFLPSTILAFYLLNREAVAELNAEAARRAERQRAALAIQLAEVQVRVMESQLHPHFLFNTLDSVVALVRDDDRERAARALVLLGELLRSLLLWRETEEVELAEELAFVERYLELMKLRFEDRLTVTWAVEGTVRDALVPPFVLQPLVENAFKHGLEKRAASGALRIGARAIAGALELVVEDDGAGPGPDEGRGLGLARTRARLAELHGDAAAVVLEARAGGGTRTRVRLPLVKSGWSGPRTQSATSMS